MDKKRNSIIMLAIFFVAFLFGVHVMIQNIYPFLEKRKNLKAAESVDEKESWCEVPATSFSATGWIPYWDSRNAFESLKRNQSIFKEVSLYWYGLDVNGNLIRYPSENEEKEIVEYAKTRGISVFGTISNLSEMGVGDHDWNRVQQAIGSEEKRTHLVNVIASLAQQKQLDGIEISFLMLQKYQKEGYSDFIGKLSERLHKDGKKLAVTLSPKTGDDLPGEDNGSHAQDWEYLSNKADRLYVMVHGQHYKNSVPGPIASAEWTKKIIAYAQTKGIPKEKISAEVSLSAQKWIRQGSSFQGLNDVEYTMRKAHDDIVSNQIKTQWAEDVKSSYASMQKEGQTVMIWLEEERSICEKMKMFQTMGIKNLSFWRLGGAHDNFWERMR